MKLKEFRELDREGLFQKEKELKKELYELNIKRQQGQVEKPARFKLLKRDIARILTLRRQLEVKDAAQSQS